jgi:hypothetical protein
MHSTSIDEQRWHDRSLSITEDDDAYASIPLTGSQIVESEQVQCTAPALPPARHIHFHRAISHTSTNSTSSTNRSCHMISVPKHSCLQITLDVLVVYSINDCQYIHEHIAQCLETIYGKRFTFYFIHRDRILGELDWLIEHTCVTLFIVGKSSQLIDEYTKLASKDLSRPSFFIVIDHLSSSTSLSMKQREKLARVYRTSNIYEWNMNSNALIHEQLELFLEYNCGSATYVTE